MGDTVSLKEAKAASAATMRAILASLQEEISDLSRIGRWVKLDGWVNAAQGSLDRLAIMNPASALIYDLFGLERGPYTLGGWRYRTALWGAA